MEQQKFTWIEPYSAIAHAVYGLRGDRSRLLKAFQDVFFSGDGISFPLDIAGEGLTTIDPFTFFASFNRGITEKNRSASIKRIISALGIADAECPLDYTGLPVVNNMRSWFFAGKNDRGPHDLDNLWDLFCSAMELANGAEHDDMRRRFIEAFDTVRSQPCIRWNITVGLYWVLPTYFMTLDSRSRTYLAERYGIKSGNGLPSGEKYLAIMDEVRAIVPEPFYQLSAEAYEWKPKPKSPKGWYPSLDEYDPGIDADLWGLLLSDSSVLKGSSRALMRRMLDYGHPVSCTTLSKVYGESKNYYLNAAVSFARRVAQEVQCPLINGQYWPVLFYGKGTNK